MSTQAITLGAIGFAASADLYDRTYGQVCCVVTVYCCDLDVCM